MQFRIRCSRWYAGDGCVAERSSLILLMWHDKALERARRVRAGTVVGVEERTSVVFLLASRLATPAAAESRRVCTTVGRGVLFISRSSKMHRR